MSTRPAGTGPSPDHSFDPAAGVMASREDLDRFAESWPSSSPPTLRRSRLGRFAAVITGLPGRYLVLVTVRGRSMQPTYHERDRVLVARGTRALRGRVIVVADPRDEESLLIKRVLACPGDPVPRALCPPLADVPERCVPPGRLVLLGDNPEQSLDSRQIGYFPASAVLGRLLRDIFSQPRPVGTRWIPGGTRHDTSGSVARSGCAEP